MDVMSSSPSIKRSAARGLTLMMQRVPLVRALIAMTLAIGGIQGPTLTYVLANFTGVWVTQSQDRLDLQIRRASCFHFQRITGYGSTIATGPTYYGVNLFAATLMPIVWYFGVFVGSAQWDETKTPSVRANDA